MKISKNSVVTIDYQLMDAEGNVHEASTAQEPWVYLHGHGQVIPGVEAALEGKEAGTEVEIELEADKAYGHHDEELTTEVPRSAFEQIKNLEVGMRLAAEAPDGSHMVTVTEITDDAVTVDANHPLAGQKVRIRTKVREVREATEEEIEHGHAHGPGGHQH